MPQSLIRDVHRRLTINTASNLAQYAVSMIIAFLLTPFIVRTLGDSLYGFWALLISFIGYASILEMGVQPAVVKLVGQYRARGEVQRLCELITAAFVFFAFVGLVAVTLSLTALPTLVQNHVEDLRSLSLSRTVFLLIALDAMVMYMNYLVTGILFGSQKYHVKNLITVVAQIVNAVLILIFLERGGILAIVACKLVMDLITAVGGTFAVRWIAPELRLSPSLLRRESFRELMGFGGRVFVSATTSRLAGHAPPLIISTALSSAAVAFYMIPLRLISYTQQIAWTLSASFMPMFSELDSLDQRQVLREIYLSYSRYIYMALLPFLVGLFVYGTPFIALWIGPEYAEKGKMVLLLLTATAVMDNAQPLLWRFFIGVGELNVLIRIAAVMSTLSILAGVALVKPLGIAGVATGVFAGAVVGKSILAVQACRQLDMSVGRLVREVHLRPMIAGAAMFLAALGVSRSIGTESYVQILGGGTLCSLFYALLAYRIALEPQERETLRSVVARRLGR